MAAGIIMKRGNPGDVVVCMRRRCSWTVGTNRHFNPADCSVLHK